MGFKTDLSNENDAKQTKETDPHYTCLFPVLECAGLIFCALLDVSACSRAVFG